MVEVFKVGKGLMGIDPDDIFSLFTKDRIGSNGSKLCRPALG